MSDWSRAFRNDFNDPEPLSTAERSLVEQCRLELAPDRKTWYCCFLENNLIGYVRVLIGGDSWCNPLKPEMSGALYCGEAKNLNSAEKVHSLGILKLRAITKK